jgi:hypothetical protein
MPEAYDAIFEDRRGKEATTIFNDGHELWVSLRGIEFRGKDFDALTPEEANLERARSLFALQRGDLCSCRLAWTMPLQLEREAQRFACALFVTLTLGDPLPNGSLTSEALALELKALDATFRSSGKSGWFEDELLDLVRALPNSTQIRSCVTCAFSDYSPLGHGLFGGLACFRGVKDDYVKVVDKPGIFAIWSRLTEFVQETYVCNEFQPRVAGTGYRG